MKITPFPLKQSSLLCGILLLLAWTVGAVDAPPAEATRAAEKRFLFVLDTSAAMKKRADAAVRAVTDLIRSGVSDQLRDGDTLGLWTYNDKINSDFPMQVWTEASKSNIVDQVSSFLANQRFEKKSRLEKVLPPMLSIVTSSRLITVVLVSDGTGIVKGTPFDADINDLHQKFGSDLREANLPFITVLVARNGAIFDYTVNCSAALVRIPATAEPRKPVATNAPAASPKLVKATPPPRPMAAPLIYINPPKPSTAVTSQVSSSVPAPAQANTGVVEIPQFRPSATDAASVLTSKSLNNPAPISNAATAAIRPKQAVPTSSTPVSPVVAEAEPAAQSCVKSARPVDPSSPPLSNAPVQEFQTQASSNRVDALHLSQTSSRVHAQAAAAVPQSRRMRSFVFLSCGLLLIFGALIVFLLRRLRGDPQPSLITQSISRERIGK